MSCHLFQTEIDHTRDSLRSCIFVFGLCHGYCFESADLIKTLSRMYFLRTFLMCFGLPLLPGVFGSNLSSFLLVVMLGVSCFADVVCTVISSAPGSFVESSIESDALSDKLSLSWNWFWTFCNAFFLAFRHYRRLIASSSWKFIERSV